MKKIFKNLTAKKWFIILLLSLALLLFGREVDLNQLIESAIVVAMQVDYQNEQFLVSTQIITMTSSTGSGGATSTKSAVFDASGDTISDSLDKISQKCGLKVSLSHCNLLLMTPSVLRLNHSQLILPMTTGFSLPIQANVVATTMSADDIFTISMPTASSSADYVGKTLYLNAGTDGILHVNIKDFLAKSMSRSGALALPYLSLSETDTISSTGGEDNSKEQTRPLSLNQALVLGHDKSVVLDILSSKYVSLYHSNQVTGSMTAFLDSGESVEFRILDKEQDISVSGSVVTLDLALSTNLVEVQHSDSTNVLTSANEIVPLAQKSLEDQVTQGIKDCFAKSKQLEIDFLRLENQLYRHNGRHTETDMLSEIELKVNVKVTTRETK